MVILKWKSDNANVLLIHSVIFWLYLGQMQSFILDFETLQLLVPTSLPCTIFSALPFSQCVPTRMNLLFLFFPLPNSVNFGLYRCFLFILVTPPHTSPFIWLFHFLFSLSLTGTFSKKPHFKFKLRPLLCHLVAFSTFLSDT